MLEKTLSNKIDNVMLYVGMPFLIWILIIGFVAYYTHAIPCSLGDICFCIGSTLNNMGCKNNLYLVMIEAHIKENLMFHKLSPQKTTYSLTENLKLIIFLEYRVYISFISKWSQTLDDY